MFIGIVGKIREVAVAGEERRRVWLLIAALDCVTGLVGLTGSTRVFTESVRQKPSC